MNDIVLVSLFAIVAIVTLTNFTCASQAHESFDFGFYNGETSEMDAVKSLTQDSSVIQGMTLATFGLQSSENNRYYYQPPQARGKVTIKSL